jgi:predicted RNA-binding Zn ribbon-like protein
LTAASIERLNAFAEPREVRSILARGTGGALTRVEAAARQASPADVVVRAFQELVAGDGLQRLKLCANPLCRWAYYDESRNRSRRWCDSAECGNVMKVRAFRARQQASDADS